MSFKVGIQESKSLPDISLFSGQSKASSSRITPVSMIFSRAKMGNTTPRPSDLPKVEFQRIDDSDCDSVEAVGELGKDEFFKNDQVSQGVNSFKNEEKQTSSSIRPSSRAAQKILAAQIEGLSLRITGIENGSVSPTWSALDDLTRELISCREKVATPVQMSRLDALWDTVQSFHLQYARLSMNELSSYMGSCNSRSPGTLEELKELIYRFSYKSRPSLEDRSRRMAILENPNSNELTKLRKRHEDFLTIGVVTEESLAAYKSGSPIESLVFFDTTIRNRYLEADADLQAIECRVFEEQIRHKIFDLLSKISDETEGLDEGKIDAALQPFELRCKEFPSVTSELHAIIQGFKSDLLAMVAEEQIVGFRDKNLAIHEKLKGKYISDHRKIAEYLERSGRFSTPLYDSRPSSRSSSRASSYNNISPNPSFKGGYSSVKTSPEVYKMVSDRSSPNNGNWF